MFELRRLSGAELSLTSEHEAIAKPRRGEIDWAGFDASAYTARELDDAAATWSVRAVQEMHSLALFTELASHLHVLGAPLDWSGAFARMIADEVRHTDLCLRLCETLGRPQAPAVNEDEMHLLRAGSVRAHVRQTVVAAFCIGESVSGTMFRRALRAANVPLARDVVTAIVIDETFHGELGWELGALLMRDDGEAFKEERARLAAHLPALFRHYAKLCCFDVVRARAHAESPVPEGNNFGVLSAAGYARAFYDTMEAEVVPGLVAIGLPEAEAAYAELVA